MPPNLYSYLQAVVRHWIGFVGGALVALLGFAQSFLGLMLPQWVFWVVALLAIAVAQYQVYRDVAQDLTATKSVVAGHVERLRPKLHIEFPGRVDPYYSEYLITVNGETRLQRAFRIGITNDSTADIPDVEVLLRDCSNKEGAVFVGHRLSLMGRAPDTVTVRPGSTPNVFANVVAQNVDPTDPSSTTEFFYYAESHLVGPISKQQRTITVAVQGGGTEDEASFDVRLGIDGTLQMLPTTPMPR